MIPKIQELPRLHPRSQAGLRARGLWKEGGKYLFGIPPPFHHTNGHVHPEASIDYRTELRNETTVSKRPNNIPRATLTL